MTDSQLRSNPRINQDSLVCVDLGDGCFVNAIILHDEKSDRTQFLRPVGNEIQDVTDQVVEWKPGTCEPDRIFLDTCFTPDQYAIIWAWNGSGDIQSYNPSTGQWTDYGKTQLADGTTVGGFSMDVLNDATNPLLLFQRSGNLYSAPVDDPTNLTLIGPHNNPSFGSSYPCGAFDPSGRYLIGIGSGSTVAEVDTTTGQATTIGTLKDDRDGAPLQAGPGDWYFDPAGNWFLMARDIRGGTFGVSTGTVRWQIDPSTLCAVRLSNTESPVSGTGAAWLSGSQHLLSVGNGNIYTNNINADPAAGSADAWSLDIPQAPRSINDLGNQWVIPEPIPVFGWIDKDCPEPADPNEPNSGVHCLFTVKQDDITREHICEEFVLDLPGTWGKKETDPNPFVQDPFDSESGPEQLADEVWHEGCSDAGPTLWRRWYDPAGNLQVSYKTGGTDEILTEAPEGFSCFKCGEIVTTTDTQPFCDEDLLPPKTVYQQTLSDNTVRWFDENGTIPEPTNKVPGECPNDDPLLPVSEQVICYTDADGNQEVYVRRVSEQYIEDAAGLPELVAYQWVWFNQDGTFYDSGQVAPSDPAPTEPGPYVIGECTSEVKNYQYIGNMWQLASPTVGSQVQWWAPSTFPGGSNSAPHANVSDIFTVADNRLEHANGAPDVTYTETSFFFDTLSGGFLSQVGAANTGETSGTDQFVVSGYINLTKPGSISDSSPSGRTGERGGIWIDKCCSGNLELFSEKTEDTSSAERGVFTNVALPAGIHFVQVALSDLSAWADLGLSISFDDGATSEPFASFVTKPSYECKPVMRCVDTGELVDARDETVITLDPASDLWCPPPECAASTGAASEAQTLRIVQ